MADVRFGSKADIGRPALPPKADMVRHDRDVRFVPKADILRCGKKTSLFDHLVGGREERLWDGQT